MKKKVLIVNWREDSTPLAAQFFHKVLGVDAVGLTVIDGGVLDKWEMSGEWRPARHAWAAKDADIVLLGHSRNIFALFREWTTIGILDNKMVVGISSDHQNHLERRIPLLDLIRMEPTKLRETLGIPD